MSKSRGGGGGGSKSSSGGSKSSSGGSKSSSGGSRSSSSNRSSSSSSSNRPSNVDRSAGSGGRSVEINGRTVTDPKQVERIERNREASARYAVDAYRNEGTPIPAHLRSTVDAQIARGDYRTGGGYTGFRDMFDGGGPGRPGPTFEGGPLSSTLNTMGVSPLPARDSAPASEPNTSRRGSVLDLFTGPAPGSTASILGTPGPGPSPGPNVYAGLGPPGMAREDTPPLGMVGGTIPESSTPPGSAPPAEEGSPVDPGFVYATPADFNPVLASDVAVNPETQFTFEDYLAQLQGGPGAMPPPIAPLAPVSMNPLVPMPTMSLEGIGSLPAAQQVLANIPLRIV